MNPIVGIGGCARTSSGLAAALPSPAMNSRRFVRLTDIRVPPVPHSFANKAVCAKCGARGRHIDVRPNWKEQPPSESLTGKAIAVTGGPARIALRAFDHGAGSNDCH
jgi:hypothetical protein